MALTIPDIEKEIVATIRSHSLFSNVGSRQARMKQKAKMTALSDLLGWIRQENRK